MAWRIARFDARSTREIEAEILEELHAHLELAARDLVEAGMDPERARREAERRFGNFGRAFAACRHEKLEERIMVQRILLVLVVVLGGAVVVQAWQLRAGQRETERAIGDVRADVASIAQRIEERFEAALLLGAHVPPELQEPPPQVPPRTEEPAEPVERAESVERSAEPDLDELDAELPSDALEGDYATHRWAVPDLVKRVRDRESFDASVRFAAVDWLAKIAKSWDGHLGAPLEKGDEVRIVDALNAELTLTATIDAQGNLEVPAVGFVHAAGLTRAELEVVLAREVARYYVSTDLHVSKEPWAFDVLIDALRDDPDVFVRVAAAGALGDIGDGRVVPALEHAAAQDAHQAVREAAADALRALRY